MKKARTKGQYRLVLCLWLREALQMNSRQVAEALAKSQSFVKKTWSRYLHEGEAIFKDTDRGGRRRQNLSPEAEREFLDGLLMRMREGQREMDSRFIQEAYEKLVGRPVAISVVHRMLRRHDWRPVDRTRIRTSRGWERASWILPEDRPVTPYEDA